MALHKIESSYLRLILTVFCSVSFLVLGGCETISKKIGPIINQTSTPDIEEAASVPTINDSDKLAIDELKAQMDEMLEKQKELQAKLEQQKIKLILHPTDFVNAAKGTQPTSSTVYVAILEDKKQFLDVKSLATKEYSIIPDRDVEASILLPEEAKYIAINIDLRYTKKRSQFLIPIKSIDFKTPLFISIGACDSFIESGIKSGQSSSFEEKLEFYQTPLASCL